jgi:hypothetical protein
VVNCGRYFQPHGQVAGKAVGRADRALADGETWSHISDLNEAAGITSGWPTIRKVMAMLGNGRAVAGCELQSYKRKFCHDTEAEYDCNQPLL